jgi:hypothetical protein
VGALSNMGWGAGSLTHRSPNLVVGTAGGKRRVRGSRYLTLLRSRSYSGGTCIVAVSGTAIGAGPGAVAGAGAATSSWGLGC